MIHLLTIHDSFEASHEVEKHPTCGRLHGHTFKVDLTVLGDPNPEVFGMIADPAEVGAALGDVLYELDGRHLNDMMRGSIPTAPMVATFIWERLVLRYKLYEVVVWQEDVAYRVRRDRSL